VSDIPDNRAKMLIIKGENIALFKYDGKLSAVRNLCKHQNGPLSEQVQKLERHLQILLFKDARQHLVEFLKDLCHDIGTPYRTGVKITLDITQSDIAALIGTSRKMRIYK
jgi:hypothetical protein